MKRVLYLVIALVVVALAIPVQGTDDVSEATEGAADRDPSRFANIQILALNDFHGQLEPVPPSISQGTPQLGGVAHLATLVREHRATNPRTVFVSAGDLIGASPLISALFHDEPSIEAFNLMDLDFNAVGNHEFDEGAAELLRMQEGGCHPVDGCLDGDDFAGAEFQFLAANVEVEATGKTLFPGVGIYNAGQGVRIAFIGMTLEGTPSIVTPSGVAGLNFFDEADTANALIDQLKDRVDIIVVLIHEGGAPSMPFPYDGCPANGISGAIVDIVERTSDEADLFITGHTHNAYICEIDGRPVTSSLSFSRVLTDIDISYDRLQDEIVEMTIDNIPVVAGTPAPDLEALVAKYKALSAPLANAVIGSITADITRTANAAGESALGDVIADAQLAATAPAGFGEATIAFQNPGGIRADLLFANSPGGEAPGDVTYGEAFSVQPFGNSLVTMTLTGQQIKDVLELQFDNPLVGQNRIMQVSNGFTYSWSLAAPTGSKVSGIALDGVPLDLSASYRVTVNSFMAEGGDNFTVFKEGTDRLGGPIDLDALADYFGANSPVAPGPQNRITQIP